MMADSRIGLAPSGASLADLRRIMKPVEAPVPLIMVSGVSH